jgi:hypothetical protein
MSWLRSQPRKLHSVLRIATIALAGGLVLGSVPGGPYRIRPKLK